MKNKFLFILPMLVALVACSNGGSNTQPPESDKSIYHDKGAPSNSLGDEYDHYYDETSRLVYEKRDGVWINQLTKGSSSLYETKQTARTKTRASLNAENYQKIKDALMTSFYSTNMTFTMAPRNMEGGNNYVYKVDKRNITFNVSSPGYSQDYYVKINDEGIPCIYTEGQGYVAEAWGDMSYVTVPHPTIENIPYTNWLLYDDELGQQTSIVCGNLNRATYDESTKEYSIKNIVATHSAITTHLVKTPTAGTLEFDFTFTLSEDETYVDFAALDFISSGTQSFEYRFSDMHSTSFAMPE